MTSHTVTTHRCDACGQLFINRKSVDQYQSQKERCSLCGSLKNPYVLPLGIHF